MGIVAVTDQSLKKASRIIQDGGLVAFPTETVYGLGCNALDKAAVEKVFRTKGRPPINPLIVHVAFIADAQKIAKMTPLAEQIAFHFWPGPLTMILPQRENSEVSELCTAGLNTIAVRFPEHEIARKLVQMAGVPIAAPSANISGAISPTSPRHVFESLGESVDMILAGGASRMGIESTIVDVTTDIPVILRYGSITKEVLEDVLKCNVQDGVAGEDNVHSLIQSPGQLLKHYAPQIPLRMDAVDVHSDEALLAFGNTKFMSIKTGGNLSSFSDDQIRNLSESTDLEEAAKNLFSYMRDLDNPKFKSIAVMNIPNEGVGVAINDRLWRASQKP